MQCPVCDVTLSISSREGVEIDFCPQCRGVWLDRGELDKVIERASAVLAAARAEPPQPVDTGYREAPPRRDERPRYDDRRYDDRRYDDRDRYRGKRKKRRGFDFLEELFDFD